MDSQLSEEYKTSSVKKECIDSNQRPMYTPEQNMRKEMKESDFKLFKKSETQKVPNE